MVYNGTLEVGKLGTRLPALVTRGAAKMVLQQFFSSLAEQVDAKKREQVRENEEQAGVSVIRQAGGDIVILPPLLAMRRGERGSVSQTLARWLGLGAGDPEQEALWGRRFSPAWFACWLFSVGVGGHTPAEALDELDTVDELSIPDWRSLRPATTP